MNYRKGYKYQLTEDYDYVLEGFPAWPKEFETDYLFLGEDNFLVIKKGYTSDGPSGPTIDTKNFMRGAFVHDALYQLIRLGALEKVPCRKLADKLLYKLCREDGMCWPRATWVYYGVRIFGNPHVKREKPTLATTPKS